jgi:hypothetical protein
MDHTQIVNDLERNAKVFNALLGETCETELLWKPAPDKWCLLEIVGHLYDEEREDFRARLMHVLATPTEPMPSIDPVGWVTERGYMDQNYNEKLSDFLLERGQSVAWLRSLSDPDWDRAYEHPKLGKLTAKLFLANWLAHDYLHIRQITRLKFNYLKDISKENLSYAGEW